MAVKKKKHYVDNEKFFNEIMEYKKQCKEALEQGKEKPRISEYIGKCIYLIAENLSHKPRFINYSFRDELVSDAIENCFLYFDNFNPEKSQNPFAYFTQIIYYAFHRRISKEEKNRYIIYKKFQESVLDTSDSALMVDADDNHVVSSTMYDNLNDFIKNFETREQVKKEKRKEKKEGLEKFVENDDEGRTEPGTLSGDTLD
jgi:DNA-directed RNA polymerase specialized sigma24 family protein